jgi:hypothetical protein
VAGASSAQAGVPDAATVSIATWKKRCNPTWRCLAQEKRENGMNSGEARRAARRQFGNATVLQESGRNVWTWRPMEEFVRDVRFALRAMRRSPGFTTVAVTTLALGIGANAAIFTAVDVFLLRPLPFADGRRLVLVSQENEAKGIGGVTSFPEYIEWKRSNRSFDALGAYGRGQENLAGVDEPERIAFARVTASLLEMLAPSRFWTAGFFRRRMFPAAGGLQLRGCNCRSRPTPRRMPYCRPGCF